jgi:hypothetical protein
VSAIATDRLIRGWRSLFQAVSKRLETAKILIGIGNYAAVSLFHDFREWATGNLKLRLSRWFLAPFKLRRPFPQNRETAKQRPISDVNTGTCLFHPGLKQPETVRNSQLHFSWWES